MNPPLLSIVIANYNYGRFLDEAIQSVLSQSCDDYELIICDGGSTDNSVEIIKKYENRLAWWCSEKDKGQSDAFNKGFARARGKYLTWLNADDVMLPGAIAAIVKQLKKHPDCEWFTGNFFRFTQDRKVIECAWGPHYLPKWLQTKHQPVAVYGPATIFTKELFERVGRMKIEQYSMMDTDLWMRFIVAGVKQRRINAFLWAFRMHEASKTAEFGEHKMDPELRVRSRVERKKSLAEVGYVPSSLNLNLVRIWRIFDGSILRTLWLKMTFKGKRI